MLGVLKRRWKPRRSPRRGARTETECDSPPPDNAVAMTPNLRMAAGRIEFVSPPPGRVDGATQTDVDPALAQINAQAVVVAKLQRQIARSQEERELRLRAEAARCHADHAKLAALGRALRKEKLRSQAQAQQASAGASAAQARWQQAQDAVRRLAQENVSLRAQLEHCCAASEALCAGLSRARQENEALVAEATRCERCLEDVARGVMAALLAQARLRARIGALGKQPGPITSRRDSVTWGAGDSSAGDGDACADGPSAADFCAGAGDDGYSTMSPDLPRALVAAGNEPSFARLRHSFPPSARPRPLAARSLAAAWQPMGALGGWGALSDWSMSSDERLSGSGSSDWSCQPGVDFTRDFYRLVRFGSQRSLASRGGGAWPRPIAALDGAGRPMAMGRGNESPFGSHDDDDNDDEQYLQREGLYLHEEGAYVLDLGSYQQDGAYLQEARPGSQEEEACFEEERPCCQGNETCCQGNETCCEGNETCCQGNETCCQGNESCCQGNESCCQGNGSCCQGNGSCCQGNGSCCQEDRSCQEEVPCGPCVEQEEAPCVKETVPSEVDDPGASEEPRFCSERAGNLPFSEQVDEACSVARREVEQRCQPSQETQREGSSDSDAQEDQVDSRVDVYQRLHRLHKVRRHRKADAARAQRLRSAPARASILERAVFTRFGPAEQAAVARFDFLSCHDDPQPGFHDDQPDCLDNQSGFQDDQPGFLDNQSGFQDDQPGFHHDQPGFQDDQPGFHHDQPGFQDDQHPEPSDDSSSSSSESSSQWEYVALADSQWEALGDSSDQWESLGTPVDQWHLVGDSRSQWDEPGSSRSQWDEPGSSRSQWARVESSEESSEEATQQLSLSDSC